MMPLPQLGVEFVLGIGAALFAANLWVLLRPFLRRGRAGRSGLRPPSPGRVVLHLMVGALAVVWALATLVARG